MASQHEIYLNDSACPDPANSASGNAWSNPKVYRIHVLITKDDEGVYSAVALNLPGAGSCGDTAEETMGNFKEAVRGILESYEASDEAIPWKEALSTDIPFGAMHKWIVVYA